MLRTAIATLAAATAAVPPLPTGRLAAVPGTCAFTRVLWVGRRLADETGRTIAGSGSAVTLANGVQGTSYDQVPAVNRARRGDLVMTCLARLPTHCPPGDSRGKWYVTADLRTSESWLLPDAEHGCGGA